MQYDITHSICYFYSRDVFLEPHSVLMQPRNCGSQTLEDFELEIDPAPAGLSQCIDAEGNIYNSIWFDGLHSELKVTARSCVKCERNNPFDYLWQSDKYQLPLKYDTNIEHILAPYFQFQFSSEESYDLEAFSTEICEKASGQLLAFLDQLTETLYKDFDCIHREIGNAWPASYTLGERHGACRDLAVLFMAACRCQGIAARFVSGYQEGDSEQDQRHLHAWAEVYIPGAGWRGYDPTHGLAVANRHVAVAASTFPNYAAPLKGSFRGSNVTMTMKTEIDLYARNCQMVLQQAQQQLQ